MVCLSIKGSRASYAYGKSGTVYIGVKQTDKYEVIINCHQIDFKFVVLWYTNSMKFIWNAPILIGISWLFICAALLVSLKTLPPQIPLFYSLPTPSSQVVSIYYLAILPGIALLCVFLNSFVLKRVFQDNVFGQHIIDNTKKTNNY